MFATNELRVRHRSELIPILREVFASDRAARWLKALGEAGVPCGPVRSLEEVFTAPEGLAMVQTVEDPARGPLRLVANPIRFSGGLLPVRLTPPSLGEHTKQILRPFEDEPR
jgi:crotonobetainyl-CoA:carnitine CoA-transferase CaiB-like acyl-CoA transferase